MRDMQALSAGNLTISLPAVARAGDVPSRRAVLTADFLNLVRRLRTTINAARVAPGPI